MRIRVLGCSGGIGAGSRTSALLIDRDVLIDAGTGIGDLALEDLDGRNIPIASRVIRVAKDFERFLNVGLSSEEAKLRLRAKDRWYDPAVLTALDAQLLDEAAESGMPVTLSVLKGNPARHLYERLGFRIHEESDRSWTMRWQPSSESKRSTT